MKLSELWEKHGAGVKVVRPGWGGAFCIVVGRCENGFYGFSPTDGNPWAWFRTSAIEDDCFELYVEPKPEPKPDGPVCVCYLLRDEWRPCGFCKGAPPERITKELVPHWPVVMPSDSDRPYLSDDLYTSEAEVKTAYPNSKSARLATELPPIMLEVTG